MNAKRVADILKDKDFLEAVELTKTALMKKAIAKVVPGQDQLDALAMYHGLGTLIATMNSEAQNQKEELTNE